MDHIHVVNQVIEKSAQYLKPIYMAFIDYKKAFDSAITAAVLTSIKHQRIEETYIRLLDDIYKGCTGKMTLHKQSDKFPFRKRVSQGDTILTMLFAAYPEGVFRKLNWKSTRLRINGENLSHLRFADD